MMPRALLGPALALVVFGLFCLLKGHSCAVPPHVKELASFRYRSWRVEAPKWSSLSFSFSDVGRYAVKTSNGTASIVEKMKVSVVKGKKVYLLIGGLFIEEGKSYSGVRFLGVRDGEVLIEVDGKVYKKKF